MGGTQQKGKRKKKGPRVSTIILIIILGAGIGILSYPTVSDYWNSLHQTRAIANYDETVASMSEAEYDTLFTKADTYNEKLRKLPNPFLEYEELNDEYYSVLDVTGTGIMGYVTISAINVKLPIYHGTSEEVLNVAAGHLEGSSLPVGGEANHAVISAHRGLPSAKLFTNLDKLQEGDVFTVTVLNRLLTYEIDQILVVDPDQIQALYITDGEDYCTLMTCTPYGINTQRLLVRGHRIENLTDTLSIPEDAVKLPVYIVIPSAAIPTMLVSLAILFTGRRKPVRKIRPDNTRKALRKHRVGQEETVQAAKAAGETRKTRKTAGETRKARKTAEETRKTRKTAGETRKPRKTARETRKSRKAAGETRKSRKAAGETRKTRKTAGETRKPRKTAREKQ